MPVVSKSRYMGNGEPITGVNRCIETAKQIAPSRRMSSYARGGVMGPKEPRIGGTMERQPGAGATIRVATSFHGGEQRRQIRKRIQGSCQNAQ